jgi:hypothetical protein
VIFPEKAKNVPIGKNCRRGRPRNTESALNRQNDDNHYTESSGSKEKNQNEIESNEKNNENQEFEDDIIYIETVRATNTNFVNCGASTSRGRGGCRGRGKTAINSAYYFSNEYLKAV